MNWVDMISGIFEPMGIEPDNFVAHRRILAFLTGGMIPFISLTFAHMLIVYSSRTTIVDEIVVDNTPPPISPKILSEEELIEISRNVGRQEAKDVVEKINPTSEELEQIQTVLESLVPMEEELPIQKKTLTYTKNA